MADIEKVIKGLELVQEDIAEVFTSGSQVAVDTLRINNALELLKEQEEEIENLKQTAQSMMEGVCLLKEQEAVVHPEVSCEMTYLTECCCDLCGVQLIKYDNFCRGCGKPIVWEGR